MQDSKMQEANLSEDAQFREFKRAKKIEETKASLLKIESDCLSPFVDKTVIREACKSASAAGIGAIVVFPSFVKACVSFLGKDPQVSLIAAVCYPYGGEVTEIKTAAVKRAVRDGVDEVEVCAPTAFIKDGNWAYLKKECKKLKKAAKSYALRIVFDCSLIGEKELLKACSIAAEAGVNCLRLNNADGELISKVKAALKGKSQIKADKCESAMAFANLILMGADTVSCTSAVELASYLIKEAEAE